MEAYIIAIVCIIVIILGGVIAHQSFKFYLYYKKQKEPKAKEELKKLRKKKSNSISLMHLALEKMTESNKRRWYNDFPLGTIIGGFIILLVGFSLIDPISKQVNGALNSTTSPNATWGATVLNFIPGLFFLGITIVFIAWWYSNIRSAEGEGPL